MWVHFRCRGLAWFAAALVLAMGTVRGDWQSDLEAVRQVAAFGANHEMAAAAAERLQSAESDVPLVPVLLALEGAGPVAQNWLRGIAGAVAARGPLPEAELRELFDDRARFADARYEAFVLLTGAEPALRNELLKGCLDDPSLRLRYFAVTRQIEEAKAAEEAGEKGRAIAAYQTALDASRNASQIDKIAQALQALGRPVDIARQGAFVRRWQVIAPFDNSDEKGFEPEFGPEADYQKNAAATQPTQPSHEGKSGAVAWRDLLSDNPTGVVDLNPVFDRAKGAVAYAFTVFESPIDQPAQVRIGTPNAHKVWVNGQLVMSNEVYHTGSMVDQYVANCQLLKGKNTLLVKLCQNEMTQPWAQEWMMQFRLTDPTGKGLLDEHLLGPSKPQADSAAKPNAEAQ